MTLALGSDHAGFELRQAVQAWLEAKGHKLIVLGAPSAERYDYPCASDEVCQAVLDKKAEFGILICGTGIGVSIRANRYPHIRAALCTSVEMAELARAHNHANVLCLGARILEQGENLAIVEAFLNGTEDHAERHAHRVDLLDAIVPC